MDDARKFMGVCPQHDVLQAFSLYNMTLASNIELESYSLATELAVLTGLILPFLQAQLAHMGTYVPNFQLSANQGSLPGKPTSHRSA